MGSLIRDLKVEMIDREEHTVVLLLSFLSGLLGLVQQSQSLRARHGIAVFRGRCLPSPPDALPPCRADCTGPCRSHRRRGGSRRAQREKRASAAAHLVILLYVFLPGQVLSAVLPCSLAVAAVWCLLYAQTDTIYPPWLSHLLVDGALFAIGWDMLSRAGW
jgi:hypothetical protein